MEPVARRALLRGNRAAHVAVFGQSVGKPVDSSAAPVDHGAITSRYRTQSTDCESPHDRYCRCRRRSTPNAPWPGWPSGGNCADDRAFGCPRSIPPPPRRSARAGVRAGCHRVPLDDGGVRRPVTPLESRIGNGGRDRSLARRDRGSERRAATARSALRFVDPPAGAVYGTSVSRIAPARTAVCPTDAAGAWAAATAGTGNGLGGSVIRRLG